MTVAQEAPNVQSDFSFRAAAGRLAAGVQCKNLRPLQAFDLYFAGRFVMSRVIFL
jgi:hypothetical protein